MPPNKPIAKKPMDTRIAAAKVLAAVLRKGQSLTAALNQYSPEVVERDQGLLQELCFGVARYAPRYEIVAQHLLSTPIKAKEAEITALLYLGFYQLEHTRIPDHAAINSVVEATKALKKNWATGLLNGVLRRFNRERVEPAESAAPAPYSKEDQYIYAHPQWLINMLRKAWPESWPAILTGNNQHPPLTLRINQQHINRADYAAQFDLPHHLNAHSQQALTLTKAADVTSFPGYNEGWFAVQDEAAQLCANLLDLAPAQRVLDACCAPGGKTCHILEHQPALAELVALDVDGQRMERVGQNLARLGLHATLKVADAGDTSAWWDGTQFDRILLDAPCSATGVIRRHPDIKLLRRADDIAKLAELQQQLLAALWPTLAPGGRLLYATCSVLPRENEKSVQKFLAATPDAQHISITDVAWGAERPVGRQLFPQENGHDGFYYCILSKSNAA
ncbi:16S rRNA (cytosine(967)-C(5))-methyltransferase RsmB [Marinagarivorans cellulosilyticus]|uniref:16S rRNA (cytosine(967)-C(5))-methyltransferase n=1 Tax=Marinagarivorans cellulosilyticus TaxID=2721545 RepID=A0AAN1WL59_9GAMM|nr:16S rRNA (cytosine(967)-C(5))-methyltransferase RsmB [Marinagarivorans cellulosilyticus]BCD99681.1 16S rRNA (cytosine967-C5)-methyltransferase [Marinagarivorans cellulosilyticus]